MNTNSCFSADDGIFKPGDFLKHLKSGGFYRVLMLANIEATREPAYVYESLRNQSFWIRPQAEMEDGRFVVISEKEMK